MANLSTGFVSNLKILYKNYGGMKSLLSSSYFYIAVLFTSICWRLAVEDRWSALALSILPTLIGFSIAAFAIFFAIMDDRAREALRAPEPSLGDRSPLLIVASSAVHAIIVQIVGLLFSIAFSAKPIPAPVCMIEQSIFVNIALSCVGLFLLSYGIILIVASVLSIFRILEIQSR